jgi:DNA-binding MarR family transcriptional regulator
MDHALRDVGVTLVQWDALRAIDRTPGASSHDLARATFQSDQAFGTLATRLLARELVERQPGIGRRVGFALTSEGRAALSAGHDVAAVVLPELFSALSHAEEAQLLALLRKLGATA